MSIEAVRELVMRLNISTNAFTAFGLALDERVTGTKLDPAIKAEIDHFLEALGARGILDEVSQGELKPILAEIRSTLLQGAKLLTHPTSEPGWTHSEAEILQSMGETSAAFPVFWKRNIVPCLEGLSERLESTDGAFLDVGSGVGALAISIARLWPSLRVIGIDPWRPALAIGRENVKIAGLSTRIELREQAVQDLSEMDAFDLTWLAGSFINDDLVKTALNCLHRALRPGGWILFQSVNPGAAPLTASFVRLRTVLRGGRPRVPGEVEKLLRQAGFVQVQTLRSSPSAPNAMIVGRRS